MANVNLIDSTDVTITQISDDVTLHVVKDDTPSTTSTKPIENQAITNYVNGAITTALTTASQNVENFSTTEARVGTWIDGKPLYKCTYEGELPPTNATWKDYSFLPANSVKYVAKIEAVFQPANGSYYIMPFFRGTDGSYSNREYILSNFVPSSGNIAVIGYHVNSYGTVYANKPFWFTLYYTKVSDYS